MMSSICFEPEGSSSGRRLYVQIWYTTGNQKVPGNVIYQCNGWTYDNAYLITFKVGPLRTHTHLLHRSCHCWKHRRKASFGIFWSSAVAFDLFSMVAKHVPLRAIFRVGNSQKSLGTRSRQYGGWVMTGMLFLTRNCCTTGDLWLGALSHRATHRLLCSNSLPRKAFLSSPNHRTVWISLRVTFGCSLL